MSSNSWKIVAIVILGLAPLAGRAVEIEPPKVQLVDKFGVNMANGQVTHSMEVVNIGGAMGLSDTISVYGNEFDFKGYRGFNHKYYGRALDVQLVNSATATLSPRTIMRVFGPTGSADFGYYVGGVLQDYGDATAGGYLPLGDERHTLEVVGNNLIWTTPDGTIVTFDRSIPGMNPKPLKMGGTLTSVEYPNGFTVTIVSAAMSVNTNTGFQLKRIYEADPTGCFGYFPMVRTSVESGWSTHNPKHVVGVNAAYEYCPPTNTTCTFNKSWPKATFAWPHCMPDVLYRADTEAGVTTSKGVTTTYKFHPYDLAYEKEQGGVVATGYFVGQEFSPRLASISVPGNSAVPLFEYSYNNLFTMYGNSEGWVDHRLQNAGVTKGAMRGTVGASYDIMRSFYSDAENTGGPYSGISFVRLLGMVPGTNSAVDYADTEDGRISFEHTPRNFPTGYLKHSTPNESYGYTRGNLTSVNYYTNTSGYSVAAEFPAACTPTTRKTCNQATRMRDANGNWTDYTYHAASGQVETITYPPDKRGVRPQTRYSYTQLSATYYNLSGVLTQGSPIWMKTGEEYCINSAASSGNCAGGDEVVTTYQYEDKNLLLKGVTVSAPDGVRRTCYRYDIYGNQIGVTTPNANMGSCP
jgi:hypothetical protein